MIALFGQITLACALSCALLQCALPCMAYYCASTQKIYFLAGTRPAALAQLFFVTAAYVLLTSAFLANDFSLMYVAANAHVSLPFMYKLTAVWGAHEGSILFWILLLNVWTLIYTFTTKADALTLAILGFLSFCFLCFLIFTSNPFTTTLLANPPRDLNPLLQDPGFVIHPPMLYIGYVGFSITFALTQSALIRGQLTSAWAALTRKFAIAAWCFLTFGITLGSWWAYRVLGWGGFWFWDPVENASLLPWLAATAFIHVLILAEKRSIAKNWAALLSIITFTLSIFGTFLVRSGVLVSAHTFASDPQRGLFLLLFFAALLSAALFIYGLRAPKATAPQPFHWLSREMSLLINSVLLLIAMSTILLGTLYPLILDALHLGTISVGAPYFNAVMLPVLFCIMLAMCIAPLCAWQKSTLLPLAKTLSKKLFYSLLAALIVLWSTHAPFNFLSLLTLIFCFSIILSVIPTALRLPAMSIAHLGFAVMIIGIMLSSLLSTETTARLKPGDALHVGPYQFFFLDTAGISGSNYRGVRAAFEVLKQDRHITNLYPEKRIYTVRDMVMTKVDIHPSIFRDLYIALGEPLTQEEWSVRIYYKPFMRWIWSGGIIMLLGGILSLRRRAASNTIGVP